MATERQVRTVTLDENTMRNVDMRLQESRGGEAETMTISLPHMNYDASQTLVKRSWRIDSEAYRVIPKIIGAILDAMPYVDWAAKHKEGDFYILTVTANCDGDEECQTAKWLHEKLSEIFTNARNEEKRQLEIEWAQKPDGEQSV